MIYGNRTNGNKHGLVLTKPIVVDAMLDRVGYTSNRDLRNVKVIEPSAGEGAFAIKIIERLYHSALHFHFCFDKALSNLFFYELDDEVGTQLRKSIGATLLKYGATLPDGLIHIEDFLLSNQAKCDLVIGNPPYVRHEQIPEEKRHLYRKIFPTFRHRSDLYIAFYDKGLSLLQQGGTLSFICSNRWLRNQYGESLRKLIKLKYSIHEIIDLESTCPFEEDVIAYPAITTLQNTKMDVGASYILLNDLTRLPQMNESTESTRLLDISNAKNWFSIPPSNYANAQMLTSIESQGFSIGIGVATGLDRVFVGHDLMAWVEPELLLPILTSKDLRNNKLEWSGNFLLNPFDCTGKLIDLSKYPRANKYLQQHRGDLEKRHVARKNPFHWYKTIDRIKPALTKQHKIILPDISGNTHIFIDEGYFYPHHNLYYITGSDEKRLLVLAAILTSDFIRNQLLELGTTMHGGYPRWQSQNLKKLLVPSIDAVPAAHQAALTQAYYARDYDAINSLISADKISKYNVQAAQTMLFQTCSM